MIVRQRLLTNLIKLWNSGQLRENIDRLPIQLSPRNAKPVGRCCIHKERAVWKYKALPLLGFDMTDETDELTTLSEYFDRAMELDSITWTAHRTRTSYTASAEVGNSIVGVDT